MRNNCFNIILATVLILITYSCNGESKNTIDQSSPDLMSDTTFNQEDSVFVSTDTSRAVIDTVFSRIAKLSKVVKLEKEISSRSNDEQHLSYVVRKEPTEDFKYYWIQVGVNKNDRFETLLNFHFDSTTGEIFYFDVDNYERVSLKKWENMPLKKGQ